MPPSATPSTASAVSSPALFCSERETGVGIAARAGATPTDLAAWASS